MPSGYYRQGDVRVPKDGILGVGWGLTLQVVDEGAVIDLARKAQDDTGELPGGQFGISNIRFDDALETPAKLALVWDTHGYVEQVFGATLIFEGQASDEKWAEVVAAVEPVTSPMMVTKPSGAQQEINLIQLETRFSDATTGGTNIGTVWRKIVFPKVAEPPEVQADHIEGTTTLNFWIRILDHGIDWSNVQFRTNLDGAWEDWEAPTRSSGDTSVVRGGVLGDNDYEYDVDLAARGQTKVQFRYTLEGGEVVEPSPMTFDRDKIPTLLNVAVNGPVVGISADYNDTFSVGLGQTDGDWYRIQDGVSATWDVSLADADGNPGLGAETKTYRVYAYAKPKALVDLTTVYDWRDISITGTGGTAQPLWTDNTLVLAPYSGSTEVTIRLQSTTAPSGYTVRVTETHRARFGGWTVEDDITYLVAPTPGLSTTVEEYNYETGFTSTGGTNGYLVEFVFTIQILDTSSAVVATVDVPVSWYYL